MYYVQLIIAYGKEYTGRNWFSKVTQSGGDEKTYNKLAKKLQQLTIEATFTVGADGHAATLEMKVSLGQILLCMKPVYMIL